MNVQGREISYVDLKARPELWPIVEDEIKRLQAIVDKNAKTADLLDRTLTALEKQLEMPLEASEAEGK